MNERSSTAAEGGGVAALERGLTLLAAFRSGDGTLSLAELAGLTGFYKSTILRLCASLLRMGFLQRLEDGRYRLGPALFLLGRRYQQSFRVGDLVVPVLRALVEQTGESASFYIRDDARDTCLYRVESPRPVRDAGVSEGDSFPVDDSAGSRMLSAFGGAPGRQHEALRRQLVTVARRSKRIPGASAVICPVFGVDQQLAGTLVLSGPDSRFADAAVAGMKRLIVSHAAGLTRALGGDAAVYASADLSPGAAR